MASLRYNLRQNIKLTTKASAMPDFKPNIWDCENIVWYGLGREYEEVFRNMRLLRKPQFRRIVPAYDFDVPAPVKGVLPLPVSSLMAVRCRGRNYYARRLALEPGSSPARIYEMYIRYDDDSQTQVFVEDFVGLWNALGQVWHEVVDGYEYVQDWA